MLQTTLNSISTECLCKSMACHINKNKYLILFISITLFVLFLLLVRELLISYKSIVDLRQQVLDLASLIRELQDNSQHTFDLVTELKKRVLVTTPAPVQLKEPTTVGQLSQIVVDYSLTYGLSYIGSVLSSFFGLK